MTALPASIDFTDSSVTEANFKTAITNQRDFLAGLLGADGVNSTALKTLGALGNDTVAKSSNYTVIATDRGVVFVCTGTFTLSLTAAATLADGFTFAVINAGTGIVTIDPNSTEQIDGANTKDIAAGSWAIVSCTGAAFYSMGSVPSAYVGSKTVIFASSGSWVVPDGVTSARITVIGGGGGNGGNAAVGGHAGAAIAQCDAISGTLTITVGAGGNGGYPNGVAGNTSSVTGPGVSITSTGGGAGIGTIPAAGANGTGAISTGTALKTGIATEVNHFIGGLSPTLGSTTGTAVPFSAASRPMAGTRATANSAGAAGGVVIIEY